MQKYLFAITSYLLLSENYDAENLTEVAQVKINYTNIDFAGHTNNKEYIRFALNTFSIQELTMCPIEELDIVYVNQTYENDDLTILKSSDREDMER